MRMQKKRRRLEPKWLEQRREMPRKGLEHRPRSSVGLAHLRRVGPKLAASQRGCIGSIGGSRARPMVERSRRIASRERSHLHKNLSPSRSAPAADAIPRPHPPAHVETQVQGLQQMVNQLQEERDALVQELHGTPMERPRVRQRLYLSDWMQERHGDLQGAMNVGNSGKILELTSMLSNAAEKMACVG